MANRYQKPPFSKIKKTIENLFVPELNMQFCCSSYPIRGQYGHNNSVVRYYVKLGKEIIWDFPKEFDTKGLHFNYWGQTSYNQILNLVREYIETPKEALLEKVFENDTVTIEKYVGERNTNTKSKYDFNYYLTDIFKAADKRFGKEKLLHWAIHRKNDKVNYILSVRYKLEQVTI